MNTRFVATTAATLLAGLLALSHDTPVAAAPSATISDVSGDTVSAALRAAVSGNRDKLNAIANSTWDAKSPHAWSLNYLRAQSEPNREERLQGLEFLAGTSPSNEYKTRAMLALLDDESYECAVLAKRQKFNKFSRVFNRASGALSKLALFQPQDAALLVLDGVYTKKKWKDVDSPERRMAWLCNQFLAKYPDSPDAADARAQLEALKPRLDEDYVSRQLAQGEMCLANRNFDGARAHFEHAQLVMPDNPLTGAAIERLNNAIEDDEVECVKAVSVSKGESVLDKEDATTVRRAARAMVCNRESTFAELMNKPCGAADSLAYAGAAWTEKNGNHEHALAQLANITALWPQTPGAEAARAQLMNPDYSLELAFDLAMEDLQKRREEFIKTGNLSKSDQGFQLAQAGITMTGGPFAAISMPILFAGDMSIRGIAEMFRTSLDIEMLIDAAARYNARYPKTKRARQVANEVAELCRKANDLKRAKKFAEMAGGASEKQQEQFAKMSAAQMLRSAALTSDLGERRALLEKIVREYPQSKQAKRANKDLALVAPGTTRGSLGVPTKLLARDPQLVQMLGLPTNMADGSRLNGEIHKIGVTVAPGATMVEFRDNAGWHSVAIPKESRKQLLARVKELQALDDLKHEGETRLATKLIPLEISGGIGAGGIEASPKIMPLEDDTERLKLFNE
ncbi:hypothetical protein GX645_00495 [Candidatus Sumerlaeota bacterium]|nr:hypothetical protein [Candidatus Sumerlaeota bacterium]